MVMLKRRDGTVIGKGETVKDAAVQHRANLRDANLLGANLRDADLRDANLLGANLWGADLRGARLQSANLRGARLQSANLRDANLWGADLRGADLRDACLDHDTVLPTGETWKQYLAEVVPALLTAGGKTVEEIVASGAWECHVWDNCPTAVAFGAESLSGVPILLRPRARQFIRFFDAGLIPEPEVVR